MPKVQQRREGPGPTQPSPVSARLSWRKKLGFSVVAFLLLVLAVEFVGRLAGLPTGAVRNLSKLDRMSAAVFAESVGMWRPGFRGRIAWPPELAYEVGVNSLGFRGPEITREKAPARFRILCLGDSTTFSLFVDEAETYPRQLETILRRDGIDCEVINGGSPGWAIHDQLRFLVERAHVVEPDLIIHLFCTNDLREMGDDTGGLHGKYAKKLERIARGVSFFDGLREHSALGEIEMRCRVLWDGLRKDRPDLQVGRVMHPPRADWSHYEVVYGELIRFCESKGMPVVTVCFPEMDERGPDAEPPFEPVMAAIAAEFEVPFLPVWSYFRARERREGAEPLYWLPTDPHANGNGCRELATAIAAGLQQKQLGPYGKR